ncbi:hypothetical protein [Hymenobacter terrenus]|uniref:hypothetical protein n=1 Tax=Hymenobacter terrenus TaxID=1629124 RepID=UPI000619DD77|nr:hypothetical protein [Hymenobacter terrenus]
MKPAATLLCGLILGLLAAPAHAQAARDLTDIGLELYQRANAPNALERMRKDLIDAPEAYLVAIDQPGTLVLLTKRRIRVPALKYNVALHLVEAQDSTGSHVWPVGSIDGFYMGQGSDARHFRSCLVRDGSLKKDFVEILTEGDAPPIVLGVQHVYFHEDAAIDPVLRTETRKARTAINQVVLTGPGASPQEPLRPVTLNQRGVTRLFGPHAAEVQAYATKEHLSYTDLGQVLRIVEYYNQKTIK